MLLPLALAAAGVPASASACTLAPGGVPVPMDWRPYVSQAAADDSEHAGVALEVGSYDGSDAHKASTVRGVEVEVFEPSPRNFARCVSNYPPQRHPRLHFHQVAASAESGWVEFWDDGGSGACIGCHLKNASSGGTVTRVRAERLDGAPQLSGKHHRIGVVKIDVQGHELPVIRGMSKWLARRRRPKKIILEFDPCLMSEVDGAARPTETPTAAVALLETLSAAGYRLQLGSPYPGETWYWAYARLAFSGALAHPPCTSHEACAALIRQHSETRFHTILTFPAENLLSKRLGLRDRQKVDFERARLASGVQRPATCSEAALFFCPSGTAAVQKRLFLKAMYTDLVATDTRQ